MNLLAPQGSPTYIGVYRIIALATGFPILFRTGIFCRFILRGCTPSCGRPANTSVVFSEVADNFGMGDTHAHLACLE